ncbi:hemagglutinin/amebocyte aggregation factor-like [Ascaphus truei]|uniref:hemagglutinin/amebocyte aggregation factor-like n=1 Tax=Ascaphus truei TaxID=8439 RepID=UPI003F59C972
MDLMMILLLRHTAKLLDYASKDGSLYYHPFNFTCPDHQSISLIISLHRDDYKDELWEFGCKKAFSKLSLCNWTDYISVLNGQWQFGCLYGKVITGMGSYYDFTKEERRWKFLCCSAEVRVNYDCQWNIYFNSFDGYLSFEAPTHYYLVGIASFQDNLNRERNWRYYYCTKNKRRAINHQS